MRAGRVSVCFGDFIAGLDVRLRRHGSHHPGVPRGGMLQARVGDTAGVVIRIDLAGHTNLAGLLSPYAESPEPVRLGMTRVELEEHLGTEDPLIRLAAKTVETPVPASATCVYSREWEGEGHDMIVRFCFRDDRLTVVDRFPVDLQG